MHDLIDHLFIPLLVLLDRCAVKALQDILHVVVGFLLLTLARMAAANAEANWASVGSSPYSAILVLREAWITEPVFASSRIDYEVMRNIVCDSLHQHLGRVGSPKTNVLFVLGNLSFTLMALKHAESL